WFMGKDVAKVLGYKNPSNALQVHVDAEDKTSYLIQVSGSNYKANTLFINESGLYSLILASKLPQAKAFKRWVTREVLPQIRKTGGYIPLKDGEGRELTDLEIMCRAMQIMKKSIEQKDQLIADLQPKADYVDEVLDSVDCLTMTQVAKGLGMTVHDLTTRLLQDSIIYEQSGQYMLYAPYARRGLATCRTHTHRDLFGTVRTRTYLVWTEKGKQFIHDYYGKK
ncbi:MAG: phage antirepressor KilAC domain-containing protein, partial [Prevotella sp.]|nr:phage antirepressor KilAC domain-containing protein [Prevotella sp.]